MNILKMPKSKWCEIFILIFIIAIATWLRVDGISEDAFAGDELAYVYLDEQNPNLTLHPFSHAYDSYIYFYSRVVHFFGGTLKDEFTFRFLSIFLGIGTVILVYITGKLSKQTMAGLTAAALLAISPASIAYSRAAIQYSSVMFGCAWVMVSMLLVLNRSQWWTWLLLILSSAFVYFVQVFSSTIVLAAWLTILFYGFANIIKMRKMNWRWFVGLAISSIILLILCLPEYIFYIKPALAAGGRLDFDSATKNAWQTLDFNTLWARASSRFLYIQKFYLFMIGSGLVWCLFKARKLIIMILISAAIIFFMLNFMKLSFGFRDRYLFFLIPIAWFLIGGALQWFITIIVWLFFLPASLIKRYL